MAADERTRPRSPERIGRYQVLERIGRGAMGVVYRARDEAMGREVALKVLTADIEDDPDIRARFLREAEAAARLSHPNIITIFDVGEEGERFFIVMELLRGATLKDFLKQPEATRIEQKIDLMVQLATGLGAAHNAAVYHRDIKPGNVWVRSDGLLKILDFGVARLASSSMTASGFIVGTPDYMSPEQARGIEVDARSDIFSLGGVSTSC
jgi:serine/threonine protein kinase